MIGARPQSMGKSAKDLIRYDRGSVTEAEVAAASLEEVELWLCTCLESAEMKSGPLTEWEVEFIKSVDLQYTQRVNRGFSTPLSLKQLIRLRMIFNKLANDTAMLMARTMGNQ